MKHCYLILVLLPFLFCNCTQRYQVKKQLDRIEAELATDPQQAKRLLEAIPLSNCSTKRLRERHVLLQSQIYKQLGDYEKAYNLLYAYYAPEAKVGLVQLSPTATSEQPTLSIESTTPTSENNKPLFISLIISILVFLSIMYMFYLYSRQVKMKLKWHTDQINLQTEKTQRLTLEMKLKEENLKDSIQELKLSEPVSRLHRSLINAQAVREQDWKDFYAVFNEKLPSFEQILKSRYPLSESELQICMLIKLEFSPGDIAVLTNKTKASISLTRTRLYSKLFQKEGTAKDFDEFIRSV